MVKRLSCSLCLISLFMLMVTVSAYGGTDPRSDLDMMRSGLARDTVHAGIKVSFMQLTDQSPFLTYNPLAFTLGGLMYVYQRLVSPQLPSECLFEHSCSSFSRALIAEYGLFRGVIFTADRLMRCNRISASGIHPISLGEESGKIIESVSIYKCNH